MKETFEKIYRDGKWGPGTGQGSKLMNSIPYLEYLFDIIKNLKIKTILDIGCGDCEIYNPPNENFEGVQYHGVDICNQALQIGKSRFGYKSEFTCENAFSEEFKWNYDLVIIKDVLQHLPYEFAYKACKKSVRAKYVLVANDIRHSNSKDIEPGEYRGIDLESHPFNEPAIHSFEYESKPRMKRVALFIGQELAMVPIEKKV